MSDSQSSAIPEIDIRNLVPVQRHAKIFEMVDNLKPGGAFVFINDHDPNPLHYQLEAEHPKQFSWTYLESGPHAWKIRIGKPAQ